IYIFNFFFFSSRRRHTRSKRDWSSDVCSSDLGLYVGYRYYDKKELQPLYSFGHGLSYTQFKYSEMIIDKESMKDEETVEVRASIKNIVVVAGKEIAQLYVSDLTGEVDRPQKALKGFEKISLQ